MNETMKGKRLAVLGANNIADEIMDYAHTHGITVLSVGNNPDAAMHKVSDEQYVMNNTDEELMLNFFKEQRVDGVLSISLEKIVRKSINLMARTSFFYYAKPGPWSILMSKQRFKEYSQKFGIKVTPTYRIEDENIQFPVVVKPTEGSNAFGMTFCRSRDELLPAVEEAREKSLGTGNYICEKFLKGYMFLFYLWRQRGKTYVASTSRFIDYDFNYANNWTPFLQVFPGKGEDIIKNELFAPLSAMFDELGVENGSCFFQGIVENGIPYIFDTGFRLPGSMDYRIVKKEKGIDLIGCHIQHALTGEFGDDFSALETPFQHYYAILSIGLKNGVIGKICGMDTIADIPGVYHVHQYRKEGDVMTKSGYTVLQDLCRVYIEAPDKAELLKRIQKIVDLIQVENDKGENMLRDYPEGWQDYFKD